MISSVLFIGSKAFGLNLLKQLRSLTPDYIKHVATLDDTDDSRSYFSGFQNYAKKSNISLSIIKTKKELYDLLEILRPDLCIVCGWYQLIDQRTLLIPKFGFIGFHHSLLPKYRGGSPLVWQLINNETEIGSSVFHFNSEMDAGDIILQVKTKNTALYIDEARSILEKKIIERLKATWIDILNNAHQTTKQDESKASYCAQLFEHDGKIDWKNSAQNILNKIRAQSIPYPCAFSFNGDVKIRIVSASLFPHPFYGIPGQLAGFSTKEKDPIICCGDSNAIVIENIKSESGQIIPARESLRSIKIRLS